GAFDAGGARLAALLKGYRLAEGESIDVVDDAGSVIASTDGARVLTAGDHAGFMAGLIKERLATSGSCHGCHESSRVDEVIAFAPLGVARGGVSVREPQ